MLRPIPGTVYENNYNSYRLLLLSHSASSQSLCLVETNSRTSPESLLLSEAQAFLVGSQEACSYIAFSGTWGDTFIWRLKEHLSWTCPVSKYMLFEIYKCLLYVYEGHIRRRQAQSYAWSSSSRTFWAASHSFSKAPSASSCTPTPIPSWKVYVRTQPVFSLLLLEWGSYIQLGQGRSGW